MICIAKPFKMIFRSVSRAVILHSGKRSVPRLTNVRMAHDLDDLLRVHLQRSTSPYLTGVSVFGGQVKLDLPPVVVPSFKLERGSSQSRDPGEA